MALLLYTGVHCCAIHMRYVFIFILCGYLNYDAPQYIMSVRWHNNNMTITSLYIYNELKQLIALYINDVIYARIIDARLYESINNDDEMVYLRFCWNFLYTDRLGSYDV